MHSQWPASKTKTCHITRRFQENPPTISRAIGRVGPFFSIHVVQMFCTLSFQKNYICPEIYAVVGSDFPGDTLPCFARVSSTSVTSVRPSVRRPSCRPCRRRRSSSVRPSRRIRPVVSVPSSSVRPSLFVPSSSDRPFLSVPSSTCVLCPSAPSLSSCVLCPSVPSSSCVLCPSSSVRRSKMNASDTSPQHHQSTASMAGF